MLLEVMPDNIRTVANFLPLTHVVSLLQSAFDGQLMGEQQTAVMVLGGIISVCGTIGAISYKRRKWA